MDASLILLTIGLPWLGALVVWLVGDRFEKAQHTIAVIFSVASAISACLLIPKIGTNTVLSFPVEITYGDFSFVPDALGVFLAVIATVIGSIAVIFSVDYMKHAAQLGRYYAMVLFFIGAMAGLVLTSNMLLMFVFWEITALCSYALISFYNDDPKAVAGGLKALIITQVGGLGLMLGALVLFAYTNSFNINMFLTNPSVLPAGLLSVMAFGCLVAAAAKSAQFPFQTWLPDAMEAPSPISALIHAATMVNAGVYLLARFFPAFQDVPGWRMSVMLVGMISALIAALMALVAVDLKRVLAYSTVSQLGYMVYAIGAGGIFASQLHLMSHSVFKALLFLAAGAIIHSVGTRDMREMGGLGTKFPFVRIVFVIGALALAGIPIFNGFWSKELILEAGMHGNPIWIAIIMVVVAGITALYTFRCVWLVFYGEERSELHVHPVGIFSKIALTPLAVGAVTTWLLAGSFARVLKESLPMHDLHELTTMEMVREVMGTPATYIALAVVALGLMTWVIREQLSTVAKSLKFIQIAAENSFGFEAINRGIVSGISGLAESLRGSQTGQLNWNVFGIVAAVILVLAVLLIGA